MATELTAAQINACTEHERTPCEMLRKLIQDAYAVRAMAAPVAEPTAPKAGTRRVAHSMRFVLRRKVDVTGTSGTGDVAEGCQFESGRVALTWKSHFATVAIYDNMQVVEHLHGHEGATSVVWVDD